MDENQYIITNAVLLAEISSLLRNASAECLDIFVNGCAGIPALSPCKTLEMNTLSGFYIPLSPDCFLGGTRNMTFVWTFLLGEIPILNSETNPLGFTPLPKRKDELKVQLQARKSINQLIRSKRGPTEAVSLRMPVCVRNIGFASPDVVHFAERTTLSGDLVEPYIMDLEYDGLYRSWSFLTTRLVIDKTTIPLPESNFRHFVALEVNTRRVFFVFMFANFHLGFRGKNVAIVEAAPLHFK
ncbi:LOW QUALITY PROTEIN: hypothetical protein BC936DRAFT_147474 [Jimgerdemannia flammicorona]|uniref:Uncharacterized protein n=1 Tax=Jimgerdemannia flammicorona TaxID=994334 RepID=A0A433D573_9FUNG|nr:LOW QUALITY PROTEIN: hypothetical protein BC936DRAFT_147474 [Jimgerdemannia flammicorona]